MTACSSYRQEAEVSYQQVRQKVKVLGSAVPTGRSHCGRPPDRQQEAAVALVSGSGGGGHERNIGRLATGWLCCEQEGGESG